MELFELITARIKIHTSLESVNAEIEALGDPAQLQGVKNSALARLEKIKGLYASGDEIPTCLKLSQTVISLDDLGGCASTQEVGDEIGSFRAAAIPGFVDSLDKEIVKENVKLLNVLYYK